MQQVTAQLTALEQTVRAASQDFTAQLEQEAQEIQRKKEQISHLILYVSKRAELTFSQLTMNRVAISLYDVVKSTGEVKDTFQFTYGGRRYDRLSLSEKIRAGLEVSELLKTADRPQLSRIPRQYGVRGSPGQRSPHGPGASGPVRRRRGSDRAAGTAHRAAYGHRRMSGIGLGRAYEKLPIVDTARRCGLLLDPRTLHRREVEAACPFCGDRGPGKHHLSLNTQTDQYRCNLCGASGNSVTLYARLHGVSNREAYLELRQDGKVYPLPVRPASAVSEAPAPVLCRSATPSTRRCCSC